MNTPSGPRAWIPNALTALRVVMAAGLFAGLSLWTISDSPARPGPGGPTRPDVWLLACAALFVVAAVTDALDGYLARRWRVVSVLGRIMDPFADKLLVIGSFAFLAGPAFVLAAAGDEPAARSVSHVAPWMVSVILGRELLVTSIRAEAESRGVSFAADWSGKAKMVVQSVCVPGVMVLIGLGYAASASNVIAGLVWLTVGVTAWSTVPYVVRGVRVLGTPTLRA